MRRLVLPALAVLVASGPALAQRPGSPPDRMGAAEAVALSAGVTVASLGAGYVLASDDDGFGESIGAGLVVFGVVVAPSLGNLLVGERRDALVGAGLRVVGAGAVAYGLSSLCTSDCGDRSRLSTRAILVSVIGGTAVFLVGTGYDLVTQARNARAGRVQVGPGGAGLALTVGL